LVKQKVDEKKLLQISKEFETWVNNPFMLDYTDRPDSWCKCSKKDLDAWKLRPYEHPWTVGAWEVWKKFNGLPSSSDSDDE
jgi:hypothetical protein